MKPAVGNEDPPSRTARRLGPWLLWFAVLGGPLAWALHLFLAWGAVELACLGRRSEVLGLPLRGYVALVTVLPLLVALTATALAWRLRSRLARVHDDDRRRERAGFTAGVGLALGLLAVAAIAGGGAAIGVFEPCLT